MSPALQAIHEGQILRRIVNGKGTEQMKQLVALMEARRVLKKVLPMLDRNGKRTHYDALVVIQAIDRIVMEQNK